MDKVFANNYDNTEELSESDSNCSSENTKIIDIENK